MEEWWQSTFPQGRQLLSIEDATGEGIHIAYGEKGEGPPLFLIHGIASWSYSWRHTIHHLANHFRVICVDAKGCGYSDKPLMPELPGHQVIELIRIIQGLCHEPAFIAAESLGALTTLAAVQTHPHLVRKLIIINAPIFPRRLPSLGMQLMAHLPIQVVRWIDQWGWAKRLAQPILFIVEKARAQVVFDPSQITASEVYGITYPQIYIPGTFTKLVEDLQLAARELDRLVQGLPNLITDIQLRLPEITCPVLILWGDQDQWFPVEDGYELQRRLPDSRLNLLPNCGHDAIGDQPELISQAICEFLLPAKEPPFLKIQGEVDGSPKNI